MLKVGDIIEITEGMKVNTLVPEKFLYSNARFSSEKHNGVIVVGQPMNITSGSKLHARNNIIEKVIEAFDREGAFISKEDSKVIVERILPELTNEEFIFNGGKFLVVNTKSDGGGTGHGPHDVYPDGWHVFLKRLNEDGTYNPEGDEIDFYQSGSFTHTHEEHIPVIGRLEQKINYV